MGSSESIAHVALLVGLAIVMAKVGGEIASRAKLPPVLGELLGGMLLGNLPIPALHELGTDAYVDMLAQLGVLILLFEVGVDSTVREVLAVGGAAARVALLGISGTLVAGLAVARALLPEAGFSGQMFLATALCSTSVGISARVFKDLGQTRSGEARVILGAAILDDVIGLVLLALVSGWLRSRASGAPLSALAFVLLIAKTVAFIALSVVVGMRVVPRVFAFGAGLRTPGVLLALGLSFCFLLSWAADAMGLAPIIGAFAAGLVLEDAHSASFVRRGERSLQELIEPLSAFLVPIFFVVMGVRVDVRALANPTTMALALALSVAAIAGKMACAAGAPAGVRRFAVAFGMVPRGEVTLIFMSLGTSLGVIDARAYSACVVMVVLTTLVTPLGLKVSFARA